MPIYRVLKEFHRTYWIMIGSLRRPAVLAICIASMAGLFELLTLFLIAPLLGLKFDVELTGVIGKIFSLFTAGKTFSNPWFQFLLLLSVVALSVGVRWIAFRHFVNLRFEVVIRLRRDILDRLIAMPWVRYHGVAAGSITNSLNQAVWQIGEGIELYLLVIANFFIVTVLISAAFFIAPSLAIIVLSFVGVIVLVSTVLSNRLKKDTDVCIQASEKAAIVSHQIYENLKYVRVSGIVAWARKMCGLSYEHECSGHNRISRTNALHHFGLEYAGMALIGVLILTFRLSEAFGFGTFIVFIGLLYRSLPRIQALQAARLAATSRLPWISWWHSVEATIGEEPIEDRGRKVLPTKTECCLMFERVGYTYTSTDGCNPGKPVLDDLTFSVKPGQLLALVGASGAGKSTTIDLLSGLISPQSGRILLDGVDLQTIDLTAWRGMIGYLPQDPLLFSGSVLSNVAFAVDTPNEEWAIACLKAAQAWDFVRQMHGGLEAQIGERGGRLSGGEKQRLALARAIYRRPQFLLLDEPTSALDEVSMLRLREVLLELKHDMAIVMVTHQMKLLDIADEVINLNDQKCLPLYEMDVVTRKERDGQWQVLAGNSAKPLQERL